jgi:hypothetical protein
MELLEVERLDKEIPAVSRSVLEPRMGQLTMLAARVAQVRLAIQTRLEMVVMEPHPVLPARL